MIVVTGGSGKAGRACIQDLLSHQYEVASVDLLSPRDPIVPFSRVDLTDYGQTVAALSGIDERVRNVTGVVHLAAIPAPDWQRTRLHSQPIRSAPTTCSKLRDSSE
jgi:nucleoside-diphosphate-sugar epimerase